MYQQSKSGNDLESGDALPPSSSAAQQQQQSAPAKAALIVSSSPLGDISPAAPPKVLSLTLSVVVGFFTDEWLDAILQERKGLDILLLFILLMFLWMAMNNAIQTWWDTPMPEDKRIWSMGWVMFAHFISYTLTLLVFRYLAVIAGEEWARLGMNLWEFILYGILFIIYFFFIYLYAFS